MEQLLQCIWAFGGSLGWGIIFNIRSKNLFFAALGGMIGWAVYVFSSGIGSTEIAQYFLASCAISLYSEIMAVIRKAPVTIFLVTSMIPLVPGGKIFYAMQALIAGYTQLFLEQSIYTFEIAGSIALGILTASLLVRIFKRTIITKYRK